MREGSSTAVYPRGLDTPLQTEAERDPTTRYKLPPLSGNISARHFDIAGGLPTGLWGEKLMLGHDQGAPFAAMQVPIPLLRASSPSISCCKAGRPLLAFPRSASPKTKASIRTLPLTDKGTSVDEKGPGAASVDRSRWSVGGPPPVLENDLLVPAPSAVARASARAAAERAVATRRVRLRLPTTCIVGTRSALFDGMHKWFDDGWTVDRHSIRSIITIKRSSSSGFGISVLKVVVVFKITVVELILNTAANVDDRSGLAGSLRSLRLTRWQTTYKIRFPAALPFIVTGMRLGSDALWASSPSCWPQRRLGYLLHDASKPGTARSCS